MVKVKEHENLLKDPHSKAIISSDKDGYKNALLIRNKLKQDKSRIASLEEQVNRLNTIVEKIINKGI